MSPLKAVIVLVQPGMTASLKGILSRQNEKVDFEEANTCPKEESILEEDVKTFNKSYRNMFDNAFQSTPSLQNFIELVKMGEMVEVASSDKHVGFFSNVCPSTTKTALYWGIPYQDGFKCWIIQPVYFTICLLDSCQNWNGLPWIPNYKFRCREKYTYEFVWSFCARGRETKFVLIRVKVPKCCVCTLSKC